jgi:hypothetical protein
VEASCPFFLLDAEKLKFGRRRYLLDNRRFKNIFRKAFLVAMAFGNGQAHEPLDYLGITPVRNDFMLT